MKFTFEQAKILDFDTENRPLSYLGHDFTTSEITAIACSFGSHHMSCWILGLDELKVMLTCFRKLYDQADIVTGHYIRGHDLPKLNGALVEFDLPPLGPKMTIDTYRDLKRINGVSKSQEALAAMLNLDVPKIGMSQADWRAANRLERVDLTRRRVIGDVRQHQALRDRLTELGWLNPPKMWTGEK